MAIDFSHYTPPGVYVEQQDVQGITGTLGVPTATVTIVGYGRGYQTHTQAVTLTVDQSSQIADAVPLAKKGILKDTGSDDPTNTIPDMVVTTFHGETLIKDRDYVVVYNTAPTAGQGITTIAYKPIAVGDPNPKTIDPNETVTVSYAYTDEFYYSPKSFTDYTVVEQTYGPAMVTVVPTISGASQVGSPLSLATRIAFANGAGNVICVALEPTTTGTDGINYQKRFQEAYDKLGGSYAHTMIVPIFDQQSLGLTDVQYSGAIEALISDVRAHCEMQSANGYGRIAIVGTDRSLDTQGDDILSHEDLAQDIHSSRVMLAYPPRLNYFNASLGQATEIGGTYLAVAYAGVLASNDVNRGLTQQTVYGFLGIPEDLRTEMDMAYKNSLSSNGVAVAEPGRTSSLVCRHGVTTDMSNLATREVSLTRTNDLIYQMVLEAMIASELVGDPIDDFMTTRVKSVVTSVLETVVDDNLILDYVDVLVRQQSAPGGDPTVIECLFTYRPMLPLNYITIGFTMDLSTGAVTPVDDTALT